MRAARKVRPQPDRHSRAVRLCAHCAFFCLRSVTIAATLAVLAAAILYVRLDRSPIHLGWGAEWIEQRVNTARSDASVSVGDLVLSLPAGSLKPVLEFRDVFIRTTEGAPIVAAPALRARFVMGDLVRGVVRPTEIAIVGPEARLIRTRAGRFRFGLGYFGALDVTETLTATPGQAVPRRKPMVEDAGMGAIATIFASFAGDTAPLPGLDALREVSIVDARLTYLHEASARLWRTEDTDLVVTRGDDAIEAAMTLTVSEGEQAGATLVATARRPFETQVTDVTLRVDGLSTRDLAQQVPGLEGLQLVDAVVTGKIDTQIDPAGGLSEVSGAITATDGQLFGLGEEGEPFDTLYFAFRHTPGTDRVFFDDLWLRAPAARTRLKGFADFQRDGDGEVTSILGQVDVENMVLDLPKFFSETLRFDDGQIVGSIQLDPLEIRIAEARLSDEDLSFRLNGVARPVDGSWQTELRAAGQQVSIADLISHWPLPAAVNARTWVAENLVAGVVDDLVAHVRIADGEPQINLDFRFSNLVAGYLGDMTPITLAKGRGHLTLHDFYLFMDEGGVYRPEEGRIALDGSKVMINELWGEITPARITLAATGPAQSVLKLIDEEPLGLVSKLGLDPHSVSGSSSLSAEISFPLLDDLLLEQILIDVDAVLSSVALPLAFADYPELVARSDGLRLKANTRGMRITGPVRIEDETLEIQWTENYGATPSRRDISIETRLSQSLIRRAGAEMPGFRSGRAPLKLHIEQEGAAPARFELDADMTPTVLAVPEIEWLKREGATARLKARGIMGEAAEITSFAFTSADLNAAGSLSLDESGALNKIDLSRIRLLDEIDTGMTVTPAGANAYSVVLKGRLVDARILDRVSDTADAKGRPPALSMAIDLDEFRLNDRISVTALSGKLNRDPSGTVAADLAGVVNDAAPVTATASGPADGSIEVLIESDEAGALLRSFGILEESSGGELTLRFAVPASDDEPIIGLAKIRDLTVNEAQKFQLILREGSIEDADGTGATSGFGFRRIRVPFSYQDEVITLGPSVASGPALALKVEGTIDEAAGELDLLGVVSPAYAISSALDNIPLLGRILTGGEGEGLLAMTFTVRGDLDDPDILVNPLSVLTPGILRRVFSAKAAKPDERFLQQLERE